MKNALKIALFCGSAFLLQAAFLPSESQAREFNRSSTVTGAKGKSAKIDGSVKGKKGEGFKREKEVTGSKGKTAKKTVEGAYDSENKTFNKKVTGYNGKEHSSSSTFDRENKTVNTDYSDGGNRTTSYGDGSKSTTYTGKNGKTASKDTDISYDKESKSLTKNKTVIGPNGETASKSGTTTYDKENKSIDRTATGYNGEERSSQTTYDKENKTVTTQGSGGWDRSTVFEEDQKTTTYNSADGKTAKKVTKYNGND